VCVVNELRLVELGPSHDCAACIACESRLFKGVRRANNESSEVIDILRPVTFYFNFDQA